MVNPRERYNAKARQSTAGGSTHKGKVAARHRAEAGVDSNVDLIVPGSEEDERRKEMERARRELVTGNADTSIPMSSNKRKRLDKFIASKLKKEERVALLAKLAESSREVEDRAPLLSAATLGTGRARSGAERLEKSAAKAKGKEEGSKRRKRGKGREAEVMRIEEDEEDADLDREGDGEEDISEDRMGDMEDLEGDDGPVGEVEEDPERRRRIMEAAARFSKPQEGTGIPSSTSTSTDTGNLENEGIVTQTSAVIPTVGVAVGSALARGPDGQPLVPVMRKRGTKRKRAPGSGTSWGRLSGARAGAGAEEGAESDSSFNSSASEEEEGGDEDEDEGEDGQEEEDGGELEGERESEDDEDDEDEDEDDSEMDEQDAILEEAMRLRGLLKGKAKGKDTSKGHEIGKDEGKKEEAVASPPWQGFSDEEGDGEMGDEVEEGEGGVGEESEEGEDEEEGEEDDEDGEDEDDDDDDEDEDDNDEDGSQGPRSRRRGIGQSKRSAGFKDWARQALGLSSGAADATESVGEGEGEGEREGEGQGVVPVEGRVQRVGDLGPNDGKARGPLGSEDSRPQSAFAAHYYELQQRALEEEKLAASASGSRSAPANGTVKAKVVRNVPVSRPEDLQEARLKLPVVAEEETIVRTVMENPVTVICGETGSGKTTQVPQFLYEAGFGVKGSDNPGMVGITQPRRVAALSMAQRVAHELQLPPTRVSHQIRYDATVSPHTAIKFMTDGVLLRELAADFLLEKYSAVLVDEAHERSVNTDVLVGVLSRVVKLREQRWIKGIEGARPLRLIIMSATLRVSDFTSNTTLFPAPPPVLSINARQHPVTVHFNRRTVQDYLAEATKKVTKIHARLPPGGVLIFLTGQQEIATVCRRLEKRFGRRAIEEKRRARKRLEEGRRRERAHAEEDEAEVPRGEQIKLAAKDGDVEPEEVELGTREEDLALDVDDGDVDESADIDALDTDDEKEQDNNDLRDELKDDSDVPMHILPLYSLLPSDKQMRVFAEPPADARLVVVATNVAETSLTIPGIKYVVDCGRAKERTYDLASGIQSFSVSWISKASAAQRAGRAGRTGPGHCYRLYSSAVFEDHFREFSSPEILRTPVEGLVLQMKAMNIDTVANFPFPTPPDRDALRRAETVLTHLGALERASVTGRPGHGSNARVTDLGRSMNLFPVAPRFAKLLVQGQQHGCLPYVVAIVAALSVGDPFLREQALEHADDEGDSEDDAQEEDDLPPELAHIKSAELRAKEERKARRKRYFAAMQRFGALGAGMSDVFRLLSVVGAYEYEGGGLSFCERNFVRPKAMAEIHKLRAQLASIVQANSPGVKGLSSPKLDPPSEVQLKAIRQLLAAAFVDQVAVRADLVSSSAEADAAGGRAHPAARRGAKFSSTRGVPYRAMGVAENAYVHPASALFHQRPPEWIVFAEVQRSESGQVWLKTLTKINPAWLSSLGRTLCTFSKPVELPSTGAQGSTIARLAASTKAAKAGDAAAATPSREVYLVPSYGAALNGEGAGGLGWELPPVKAVQRLVQGRWVTQM